MMNFDDTRVLLEAITQDHTPGSLLTETFFQEERTYSSSVVDVEYREKGRVMAPFVVPGSKGVELTREGSVVSTYKAPLMRPTRTITPGEILVRGFGEAVYSVKTPEERASEMRADDLSDLRNAVLRRQEWMAAQLLLNGGYEINGFADDGKTAKIDNISFSGWAAENKLVLSGKDAWDQSTAAPIDVLQQMSDKISRDTDRVPTIAICSRATADLLLNNAQVKEMMMIPDRDAAAFVSMQPQIINSAVTRIGHINGLNLDIYVYNAGFTNDAGEFEKYIPDNYLVMGNLGLGRRLYGAVTQLEADSHWHTYEGQFIPKVINSVGDDKSTLALSSRCVIVPKTTSDWMTVKVK